ncbi:hypothetical protein JVT61DRAFT_12613 [Boletus reticuloceps]|uniref:Uncharacterized protein n=1 Tax=Boletus reticuloceps TaxID=495285 RepID=A0A8I2YDL6_9AGAM|nr:hypothetical protein JVT61DRAFT_12613 [Boletus reticuloceps]
MPPKCSKKVKQGDANVSATAEGSGRGKKVKLDDTLHLQKRGGKATATVDDKIIERQQLDSLAEAAQLGWARLDILKYSEVIKFGRWNSRSINQTKVTQLKDSFLLNGLDRFNSLHAVPLVVNKGMVKEGTYTDEKDMQMDLPELELELELGSDDEIFAAGGQHRHKALQLWKEYQEGRLKVLQQQARQLCDQDAETDEATLATEEYHTVVVPEMKKLTNILEYGGQWVVVLFDVDKVDEKMGLHLSQNETRFRYMESPEEGLVQRLKERLVMNQNWENFPKASVSKGPVYRQHELLAQQYVFEFLNTCLQAGNHYLGTSEFTLSQLYGHMVSPYGGILTHLTKMLGIRLHMCFNTVDVTESRLRELRKKMPEDANGPIDEALALHDELANAGFVEEALTEGIYGVLEDAWRDSFEAKEAQQCFGMEGSTAWLAAWDRYANILPNSLKTFVKNLHENNILETLSKEAQTALKTCATKASFMLEFHVASTSMESYVLLPFMCKSMFSFVAKRLDTIKNAIAELSSWWSPFVYLAKAHGMGWQTKSSSVEMMRAIMSHPLIKMRQREVALNSVIGIILNEYAAMLRLEQELQELGVPLRPTTAKNLGAMFSTTSAKNKVRQKVTAVEDDGGEYIAVTDVEEERQMEDEEGSQPHAGSHRERVTKREDGKPSTKAELGPLEAEVHEAAAIISTARSVSKSTTAVLPILNSWSRSSKISSDITDNAFRGQNLLAFHTFEWAVGTGPSKARNCRALAQLSILEHSIVQSYRPYLLNAPGSAAAYLRDAMFNCCCKLLVTTTISGGLRQSTLTPQTPTALKSTSFWPDEISVDTIVLERTSFDISQEFINRRKSVQRSQQTIAVQKVVMLLENMSACWDVRFVQPVRDYESKPVLQPSIQDALEKLVEEISKNAWLQRHPKYKIKTADQFMKDAGMEPLDVRYSHGIQEDDSLACKPPRHDNFKLLTREEEEEEEELQKEAEERQRVINDARKAASKGENRREGSEGKSDGRKGEDGEMKQDNIKGSEGDAGGKKVIGDAEGEQGEVGDKAGSGLSTASSSKSSVPHWHAGLCGGEDEQADAEYINGVVILLTGLDGGNVRPKPLSSPRHASVPLADVDRHASPLLDSSLPASNEMGMATPVVDEQDDWEKTNPNKPPFTQAESRFTPPPSIPIRSRMLTFVDPSPEDCDMNAEILFSSETPSTRPEVLEVLSQIKGTKLARKHKINHGQPTSSAIAIPVTLWLWSFSLFFSLVYLLEVHAPSSIRRHVPAATETSGWLGGWRDDGQHCQSHNALKRFLLDDYRFKETYHVYAFLKPLNSATSSNAGWVCSAMPVVNQVLIHTQEDGQLLLQTMSSQNGLRRLIDIIRWPQVSAHAGNTREVLSTRYTAYITYFVIKSTLATRVNTLFSEVLQNLTEFAATIESSMNVIVANLNLSFRDPRSPVNHLQLGAPSVCVYSLCLVRFTNAVAMYPRLVTLVKNLRIWFDQWTTGIFLSPPTFDNPFQNIQGPVRKLGKETRSNSRKNAPGGEDGSSNEGLIAALHSTYDPPGGLREEGPRHDNDFVDIICDIRVAPTHQELLCRAQPFLPGGGRATTFNVYTDVTFTSLVPDLRGVSISLTTGTPPGRARSAQADARVAFWKGMSGKRLVQGGLVALVWKTNTGYDNCHANRVKIRVVFFDTGSEVELRILSQLRTGYSSPGDIKVLVESPVLFGAIRPFLEALKTEPENIPSSRYLVFHPSGYLSTCTIDPPNYALLPGFNFQVPAVVPVRSRSRGRDDPRMNAVDKNLVDHARAELCRTSRLDPSGADAIVAALSSKLALIQGLLPRTHASTSAVPPWIEVAKSASQDDTESGEKWQRQGRKGRLSLKTPYNIYTFWKQSTIQLSSHTATYSLNLVNLVLILVHTTSRSCGPRPTVDGPRTQSPMSPMKKVPMDTSPEKILMTDTPDNPEPVKGALLNPRPAYCRAGVPYSSYVNDAVGFFAALGQDGVPAMPFDTRVLETLLEEPDVWEMSQHERQTLHAFWIEEARVHMQQN